MSGQKMSLMLEPDQMAFLMRSGQLIAVYLDGAHYLDVGRTKHQIHPASQLVFVAFDGSVADCSLHIERPPIFFDTFLLGQKATDAQFVVRLIEQMIHGVLERDNASLEVMNETLATCGICCTHIGSPLKSLVRETPELVEVH